jgi:hypothetical protein
MLGRVDDRGGCVVSEYALIEGDDDVAAPLREWRIPNCLKVKALHGGLACVRNKHDGFAKSFALVRLLPDGKAVSLGIEKDSSIKVAISRYISAVASMGGIEFFDSDSGRPIRLGHEDYRESCSCIRLQPSSPTAEGVCRICGGGIETARCSLLLTWNGAMCIVWHVRASHPPRIDTIARYVVWGEWGASRLHHHCPPPFPPKLKTSYCA